MGKDKNEKIDLNKYDSPDSISLSKMNFGLWLAENKALFKRLFIIALILASIFLFTYSVYYYIHYFSPQDSDEGLQGNLLHNEKIIKDIKIEGQPIVIKSDNKYDLAVKVTNVNKKFYVKFNYCFRQGQDVVDCGMDFLLPGESKFVLSLANELHSNAPVEFIISASDWSRLNLHEIPDWNKYKLERSFLISNVNFVPAVKSGLSEKLLLNVLEFKISNKTPYSYYQVPVTILLYKGSQLVGVNRYTINDFLSSQSKSIRITWPGNLPSVSNIKIIPDVNILDDNVYLQYQ